MLQSISLSMLIFVCLRSQVDAMKLGVKEFRKEYKNINIDQIDVRYLNIFTALLLSICYKIQMFENL